MPPLGPLASRSSLAPGASPKEAAAPARPKPDCFIILRVHLPACLKFQLAEGISSWSLAGT
eukprot:13992575-Alexandrium_andersonii.AAC.1